MEKLDFEFIKNRGFGDLISDYISLFKQIFKHFNKSIFRFLLPILALFLVICFFATTLGSSIFYSQSWKSVAAITVTVAIASIVLFFYFIFIPTFGIEYMFLLEEKGNTDFSGKDVWRNVKNHLGKYILFFLASIVVGLILLIPVILLFGLLSLIPIIGQLALGILISCITVAFTCGLFLYLKDRVEVFSSFMAGFRLIKKKFWTYGLAAYLFRLLIGICLGILTIVPIIIMAIIAFNTIGFGKEIFLSFGGKMLLSLGGTIFLLFSTISSIYGMTFMCLIYFSSLETTNKEGTLNEIDQIGLSENNNEEA